MLIRLRAFNLLLSGGSRLFEEGSGGVLTLPPFGLLIELSHIVDVSLNEILISTFSRSAIFCCCVFNLAKRRN